MKKPELTVIVSLDVEEEGLFSGTYASTGCGVKNIGLLRKLAPLTDELGFPLTLFCAHTVFSDKEACNHLAYMRDRHRAEIALHLHHWSTPPLVDSTPQHGRPTPSDQMPREQLFEKLVTLCKEGEHFQGEPLTSFRMGRWDFKKNLRPLLVDAGITVDSSVCPLRVYPNGPDFFLASPDPYWADNTNRPLLVLPITQIPVVTALTQPWYALCKKSPSLLDSYHFWNVASANPVWHNAKIMRLATRLHSKRGGRVLSLFWHSSEMMAGASPNVPNEEAARTLLQKIYDFLDWLNAHFSVTALTAQEYYTKVQKKPESLPTPSNTQGDW